jgi:hypothetical protein
MTKRARTALTAAVLGECHNRFSSLGRNSGKFSKLSRPHAFWTPYAASYSRHTRIPRAPTNNALLDPFQSRNRSSFCWITTQFQRSNAPLFSQERKIRAWSSLSMNPVLSPSPMVGSIRNNLFCGSRRCQSTAAAESEDGPKPREEIVLYQRARGRESLVRSGLAFSSFHSAYWLWYNTFFIPAVNQAPMESLHVDPMIGVVGMVFATVLQTIFFVYPTFLVSKITYQPPTSSVEDGMIGVYTHTIPGVYARKQGKAFLIGDIVMDPSSNDAKQITQDLKGDWLQFRGHVAIAGKGGTQWPPYLIDLRDAGPEDVPEPNLLLEALLTPSQLRRRSKQVQQRNSVGSNRNNQTRPTSKLSKIVRRRK